MVARREAGPDGLWIVGASNIANTGMMRERMELYMTWNCSAQRLRHMCMALRAQRNTSCSPAATPSEGLSDGQGTKARLQQAEAERNEQNGNVPTTENHSFARRIWLGRDLVEHQSQLPGHATEKQAQSHVYAFQNPALTHRQTP